LGTLSKNGLEINCRNGKFVVDLFRHVARADS